MKPGQVRIIGGRLRGSRLPVAQRPGLRPTPDRLRETLFNWLGPWLPGRRVIDLYAGTGALGIEACSRGAAHVVLIERDRQLAASLQQQIERLRIGDTVELRQGDALQLLARIFHEPSTAAADLAAVARRTPVCRFDVVSTTPSPSNSPCAAPRRHLGALATYSHEIGGLARIFHEPSAADGAIDLALIDPPFADDLWLPSLAALAQCDLAADARAYLEHPAQMQLPSVEGWSLLRQSRVGDVVGVLLQRCPDAAEQGQAD